MTDNTRAIFMSDIYRYAYQAPHNMSWVRVNQKICHLYQEHGFYEFYCVPLTSKDNSKLVLTIAAQGRDPVDFRAGIDAYQILLCSLGESINRLIRTQFPELCPTPTSAVALLNRKPLLVLNTLANDDVTLAQVAQKLHLSTTTINQQIAAARKALGVKTTVGAIKKASSLGLIHYN